MLLQLPMQSGKRAGLAKRRAGDGVKGLSGRSGRNTQTDKKASSG